MSYIYYVGKIYICSNLNPEQGDLTLNATTTMIIAVLAVGIIGFGGGYLVGSSGDSGGDNTNIMISGSTTVQPLMNKWQEAYEPDHPATLYVSGGGSGAGRDNTRDGKSDIGMASSSTNLTTYNTLAQYMVAYDGVVVVVSSNVSVTDLSKSDLKDIYTTAGSTWSTYTGGTNTNSITVLGREEGSGTKDTFDSLTGIGATAYKSASLEYNSAGGMLAFIQSHDNCIGYVNMSSLPEIAGGSHVLFPNVKAIDVDGVSPTSDNVKKFCDPSYTSGTAYPLSRSLYMLTKTNGLTGEVKAFIQWMYSDTAQQIAEENGFVGLTANQLVTEWAKVR
jgi:phosphate transport system substrate-binding protein